MILPDHQEETSTASLEALAQGLPVIINHNCEIPYLTEYKAGFYLNKETNIVQLYQEIIKNKKIYSENSIKLIKEKYIKETVLENLLKLI